MRSRRTTNSTGNRISQYERVCACGDVKWVNYKPKDGTLCYTCSGREQAVNMAGKNVKKEEDKIRYYYFCPTCPTINLNVDKRRTNWCGKCSRLYAKKPKDKRYFDMETMKMKIPMRYFRICPHCPEDDNTKQVPREILGGIKPCVKHKYVDNPEALKAKEEKRVATRKANSDAGKHKKVYKKTRAKIQKKVSNLAIQKQIELNREHRERVDENELIPEQKMTDKEMMDKFLKKNKPSVVIDDTPMKHCVPSGNLCEAMY